MRADKVSGRASLELPKAVALAQERDDLCIIASSCIGSTFPRGKSIWSAQPQTIVIWILDQKGMQVPPEVAVALASLFTAALSAFGTWLKREGVSS